MSTFGALTDYFGILALSDGVSGTLATILELTESSRTPATESRANAEDENGDICASSYYGAGDLSEASSTFKVCKGVALDTALLALGELTAGKTVTSIEVATAMKEWPTITVSGTLATDTMDTSILQTFAMPSFTLASRTQAQELGFTTTVGCKLNSSSVSATVELAQQDDGLGEPVAHGVSGGEYTVSAEFVAVTDVCAWTVTGSGLTETKAPGAQEGQASYHTGSGEAQGTLVRDVTP